MGIGTGSQATVYNSIFFWNNSNGFGTPAPVDGAATIDYTDIEGGWASGNNKDADPKFVNLPGGNLTLRLGPPNSPCLDAADYSKLPSDVLDVDGDGNVTEIIPWDIAWQTRWIDQSTVGDSGTGTFTFLDMGAYELP